jgi:hypothetical protein
MTKYITTVGTNGNNSYYGTYDQTGLTWEWLSDNYITNTEIRKVYRGGGFGTKTYLNIDKNYRDGASTNTNIEDNTLALPLSFRICTINNPLPLHTGNYVLVSNANNNDDPDTGFGATSYEYYIRKYPITVKEYCRFLNCVAGTPGDSTTYDLFNSAISGYEGLSYTNTNNTITFAVNPYMDYKPICGVSWFNAARYCNWLHNGMPSGNSPSNTTTESGVYTITNNRINFNSISIPEIQNLTQTNNTSYWIPTENEWYKAAYYDPSKSSYSAIEVSSINNTGSGLLNPGDTDPNWSVVALPYEAIMEHTNTVPYNAYIYSTIPSVYVTSSLTRPITLLSNSGDPNLNVKWIGPQASPISPKFSTGIESYNIVYSGNVYAQSNGLGLIDISAAAANSVSFFIGGTLINTDTRYPTISGGEQIDLEKQGIGKFKSFVAEINFDAGYNPIFAVVHDTDSANYGGGFIMVGPSTYENLYWPYATRSVTPPCPVEASSPEGDGIDVLTNCPTNIGCSIGRPLITDFAVVTSNSTNNCDPNSLYLSWDISNLSAYSLDENGNYKICDIIYIPNYNAYANTSTVTNDCGNYYVVSGNVPKMVIEIIDTDNINNTTTSKIVSIVPISLGNGYQGNMYITNGFNVNGGPSSINLQNCHSYRAAIYILMPDGRLGAKSFSKTVYFDSSNTNGGKCYSYQDALNNIIDKTAFPLIVSDAPDSSYNGQYSWIADSGKYIKNNGTGTEKWIEYDTQNNFLLKSHSSTSYQIDVNSPTSIKFSDYSAILGGRWENYNSNPITYNLLKVRVSGCLYPIATQDPWYYCNYWVTEPTNITQSPYTILPETGCAYYGVLPCTDNEGYLLSTNIEHNL